MARAPAAPCSSAMRASISAFSSTPRQEASVSAKRGSEAGFTMIELMIAVLLTTIAMSGIIALFISQNRASGVSRHTTEASALAIDKLEKLRTMSTLSTGSDTVDAQGNAGSANLYNRIWTVSSGTGYSDIKVEVNWEETNGK